VHTEADEVEEAEDDDEETDVEMLAEADDRADVETETEDACEMTIDEAEQQNQATLHVSRGEDWITLWQNQSLDKNNIIRMQEYDWKRYKDE
jgi:hypothetical protein